MSPVLWVSKPVSLCWAVLLAVLFDVPRVISPRASVSPPRRRQLFVT